MSKDTTVQGGCATCKQVSCCVMQARTSFHTGDDRNMPKYTASMLMIPLSHSSYYSGRSLPSLPDPMPLPVCDLLAIECCLGARGQPRWRGDSLLGARHHRAHLVAPRTALSTGENGLAGVRPTHAVARDEGWRALRRPSCNRVRLAPRTTCYLCRRFLRLVRLFLAAEGEEQAFLRHASRASTRGGAVHPLQHAFALSLQQRTRDCWWPRRA
mmetsp:Transcript_14626/g.36552  ORF Transcript_14626/g.36552 Transcript_14626/m.36552 type:complete len:213 (-) Transcript_14626:24-662(-)